MTVRSKRNFLRVQVQQT